MIFFQTMLMVFLVVCAISVSFTKNIISAVIIFMSYSVIMSIVWLLLKSPDLAFAEAAIGAGITSVVFFLAIRRIHEMEEAKDDK